MVAGKDGSLVANERCQSQEEEKNQALENGKTLTKGRGELGADVR